MHVTALVLLATMVLETHCQDECSDYNVSVYQNGFLFGHDVTMGCRHQGHPNYTTIGFDFKAKYDDRSFTQAYTFYREPYANLSGPGPLFKYRLTGVYMTAPRTVVIQLSKATEWDKLHIFRCHVKTFSCPYGNTAALKLQLTEPYFHGVNMLVAGQRFSGGFIPDTHADGAGHIHVTCVAISDPKAIVDIAGVSSVNTVKNCDRVGGVRWSEWQPSDENPINADSAPQPWKCNATVMVKTDADFNISCVAIWQGQVHRSRVIHQISTTTTRSTVTYGDAAATHHAKYQSDAAHHDICRVSLAVLGIIMSYVIK